jgi:hypothetical protein
MHENDLPETPSDGGSCEPNLNPNPSYSDKKYIGTVIPVIDYSTVKQWEEL